MLAERDECKADGDLGRETARALSTTGKVSEIALGGEESEFGPCCG